MYARGSNVPRERGLCFSIRIIKEGHPLGSCHLTMSKLGRGTFHWTALPRVVACDPQGSKLSHGWESISVPYISHLPTHLLGTGLKEWNRDLTNSLRLEILFRGIRNEEEKKENKSPNPCTCKRFLIFPPFLKKMSQIRGQSKPHE